jgi:hypothetical protein
MSLPRIFPRVLGIGSAAKGRTAESMPRDANAPPANKTPLFYRPFFETWELLVSFGEALGLALPVVEKRQPLTVLAIICHDGRIAGATNIDARLKVWPPGRPLGLVRLECSYHSRVGFDAVSPDPPD